MTPSEKVVWDEAFKIATQACRDHVKFANKTEYAAKVGEAFVTSIRDAKRKAEKEKAGAQHSIVIRYTSRPANASIVMAVDHVLRLNVPVEALDWSVQKIREYILPILQQRHMSCEINVRGIDWHPPALQEASKS